ncbi:SOS response-associated peptidase [Wukongibacter baidiensis]|uniref:SOS response-associated peptidase n=1 Tax=Wukongibacter baidiensis TaxID=1723361 RepID=UPI003D7F4FE2
MCGRFQLAIELDRILEKYGVLKANVDFLPQKEIFPTNKSIIVVKNGIEKDIKMVKWGFTASFAKRPLINARSETVSIKPTFKDSFIQRRCLVPVSGYFEWKKDSGQSVKYIIRSEDSIFSLAGIYKSLNDRDGRVIEEYTILTRPANKNIRHIHERMPVIIDSKYEDVWLNKDVRNISLLNNIMSDQNIELLAERV